MYELADLLHKGDSGMLWMAILGLTDHLLHGHISDTDYYKLQEELRNRCTEYFSGVGRQVDVDVTLSRDGGGGGGGVSADPSTSSGAAHTRRITTKMRANALISFEIDLRFSLLRHWSLYDSMANSPYVAARLHTWSDAGRRQLELLLAKMGIPLDESRRHYLSMSPALRSSLNDKLQIWGAHFKLLHLAFPSFQLEHGFRKSVSAADCVHAATALLEVGADPGESATGAAAAAAAAASDSRGMQRNGSGEPSGRNENGGGESGHHHNGTMGVQGFWRAWRALALTNENELHEGLTLSKALHRFVVETAGRAISQQNSGRGDTNNTGGSRGGRSVSGAAGGGGGMGVGSSLLFRAQYFWILDLSEGGISMGEGGDLLLQPLALTKLGLFLQEWHLQRSGKRPPPMVVVGPPSVEGMCNVVGLKNGIQDPLGDGPQGTRAAASTTGNIFSYRFEQACERISAMYVHDSFVGSWITIAKADIPRFENALVEVMEENDDE